MSETLRWVLRFGKPIEEGAQSSGPAKAFNNKIDRIYSEGGRIKAEGDTFYGMGK